MKTILTLRTSSMFFIGSVNLYKGEAIEVNSDELSPSTIRIVNQAITSGRVHSTEGLLVVPVKEETVVVEDAPARGENQNVVVLDESPVADVVEEVTKTEPEVTEDKAPAVEAEVKTPVKKKTAPAKKKAE